MTAMKNLLGASVLGFASFAGALQADDFDTVQVFYDYLSNPGSESHAAAFMEITSNDWESIGNYSGKPNTREGLIGFLSGISKGVPDLEWEVKDMIKAEDKVIVRGRATGTPAGPFMGVDGEGRGFEIMSIDIHELEDGKIARSYHVEDWAGAIRQLRGNK